MEGFKNRVYLEDAFGLFLQKVWDVVEEGFSALLRFQEIDGNVPQGRYREFTPVVLMGSFDRVVRAQYVYINNLLLVFQVEL